MPGGVDGAGGAGGAVELVELGLEVEDAAGHVVEARAGDAAFADGAQEGCLEEADGAPGVHLQVGAAQRAGEGVLEGAPVADDGAGEAPLALEEGVVEPGVVAAGDAVEAVVGAHDAEGAALFDGGLEGGQVKLAQGAGGGAGVDGVAVEFLAVDGEVLDAGGDVAGLDALDDGDGEGGGEGGILAEVFIVAPAEGGARQVEPGAEDDVLAAGAGLLAHGLAEAAGEGRVPGGGEGRERGEDGGGVGKVVLGAGIGEGVAAHLGADGEGAVGEGKLLGDAFPGVGGDVHGGAPVREGHFVRVGESGKDGLGLPARVQIHRREIRPRGAPGERKRRRQEPDAMPPCLHAHQSIPSRGAMQGATGQKKEAARGAASFLASRARLSRRP